ncbi:GntR family transcriptional regulator [Aureimonas glaciei]|uniref:GntR family transcriptional regulator n=1 Tax=Aureimonas glaciei TaxID=1776957 RepID=A0A916XTQ4_9HYPH|nr:GntR family transcriptional regulator [Aureimonas glaciei]GGD08546.1 GntR family transcriptional regulator [Aureimonas glaciei]
MAKPGAARQGEEASWKPIHDALHDGIIRHRLDPGAKLVEDEIAELFGVSRTIVRTALQALSRDGVVVIQRNRGASVAHPLPDEAREIFEARTLVEPAIAAMAAARMTASDGERLRACLAAEHAAIASDNLREAVFLSAEFHRVIAGLAGHTVLATIVGDLLSRSSLVVALYWRRPESMCANHAHHAIVDALEAGDGETAAALMRTHLIDLLAGLDLSARPSRRSSLAEALAPGSDPGRSAFFADLSSPL